MKLNTPALRNTLANQLWRLVSAPLVLLLVPVYLSADTQGYWYTFLSLGALTVFADLGFTAIIVQFAAHEFSALSFDQSERLQGRGDALARMYSLVGFAVRWALGTVLIVTPLIFAVGVAVMSSREGAGEGWQLLWLIFSMACGANFVLSVVLAFIEGCNRVAEAHRLRLCVAVVNVVCVISLLLTGWGLAALPVALVLSVGVGLAVTLRCVWPAFSSLREQSQGPGVPWRSELLPLLRRYSLSWASGYFILQIITPMAFYFFGPAEAGRVGLSMAVWTALFTLSSSWVNITIPTINMRIAAGDTATLVDDFIARVKLSVGTFCFLTFALFVFIVLLERLGWPVDRLLPLEAQLVLALGWGGQLLVSALAIFARAHKEEPFMLISLALAVQVALSSLVLAMLGMQAYFVLGFTLGFAVWTPIVYRVYRGYAARYEAPCE